MQGQLPCQEPCKRTNTHHCFRKTLQLNKTSQLMPWQFPRQPEGWTSNLFSVLLSHVPYERHRQSLKRITGSTWLDSKISFWMSKGMGKKTLVKIPSLFRLNSKDNSWPRNSCCSQIEQFGVLRSSQLWNKENPRCQKVGWWNWLSRLLAGCLVLCKVDSKQKKRTRSKSRRKGSRECDVQGGTRLLGWHAIQPDTMRHLGQDVMCLCAHPSYILFPFMCPYYATPLYTPTHLACRM